MKGGPRRPGRCAYGIGRGAPTAVSAGRRPAAPGRRQGRGARRPWFRAGVPAGLRAGRIVLPRLVHRLWISLRHGTIIAALHRGILILGGGGGGGPKGAAQLGPGAGGSCRRRMKFAPVSGNAVGRSL